MANILIIADDPLIMEVISIILNRENHTIQTASTARNLNDIIESFTLDITILDVSIGIEDGRALCKKIQKINQDISVILMSVVHHALDDSKELCADDIIEKLFGLNMLNAKVNAILTLRKLASKG